MSGTSHALAPAVSVVMPVYNAAEHLAASISSILSQTHDDLEFIIVNDGSTDRSLEIMRSYTDPRIKIVDQPNKGIVGALNAGLAMARGALIARHDADDTALPERLARQVRFLEQHPEIGLLGTWARVTDPAGVPVSELHHPVGHAAIAYSLLFDSAFVHPSVMFRRSVLDTVGPYRDDPAVFEDFDMWSRMVHVTRTANIPEELVLYREVAASASRSSGREKRTIEQRRRNLAHRFPDLSARHIELLAGTGLRHASINAQELRLLRDRLRSLVSSLGGNDEERAFMLDDVRARLMGFHLVAHSTIFGRILDRILKAAILNGPQRS